MAAERTGTNAAVDGSAADSGSSAVTVPSDCTAVVVFYSYWDNDSNVGAPAFDFNGTETFTSQQHGSDNGNAAAVGIQTLVNPTTGSRTFNWDWAGANGARTEGGEIVIIFVKGINTADLVRASAIAQNADQSDISATVTSITTDLVLAFAQRYDSSNNNGPDFTLDGTVFDADNTTNSQRWEASEVTAGASSTTVNMTNEYFSSIAAISLKQDSATGTINSKTLTDTLTVVDGSPIQ